MSSIPLTEVGPPKELDPKMLVRWMKRNTVSVLVMREKDCGRFPALIHMFREPPPPEIIKVEGVDEWYLFSLLEDRSN